MKYLIALLFSWQASAECFSGPAPDGSIVGVKEEVTVYFQRAGHRTGVALVDKSNMLVAGDIQCSGGLPERCRIGGVPIIFQFIKNIPTLVVQNGRLEVVGDDASDLDLRITQGKTPSVEYALANANQQLCGRVFPQLKNIAPDGSEATTPGPRVSVRR